MNRKWIPAVVVLVTGAVLLTAACSLNWLMEEESSLSNNPIDWGWNSSQESRSVSSHPESAVVTDISETKEYAVKNTLTRQQVKYYNYLVAQIEEYETVFHFDNAGKEDLKAAYFAVLDDHPEYFWLGKGYVYHSSTIGDFSSITLTPTILTKDRDELRRLSEELQQLTKQIVQDAKSKGSVYEQVKYFHDYIVDNTDYDTAALDLIRDEDYDEIVVGGTAYGCLMKHTALCSGYAAAFQLLCHEAGVDCYLVNGTRATESGTHQWNFLKLDGDYYYMDVTWDDPVREDGVRVRTYEYFLISDEDLARTHTIDHDRPLPDCTAVRYNYYVYNDLYFEEYDFRYIQDAAEKDPDGTELTMKFGSPEQLELAENDLMENQRIFEIDGFSGGVSYSTSTSGCILTIRNRNE